MKRKAHGEVRQSQIITTFGPGSLLDLPKYSVIVAGLDHIQADVEIQEPRLLEKVRRIPGLQHVSALKNPPRKVENYGTDTSGLRAHCFPDWFITTQILNSRDRFLVPKRFIDKQKYKDDEGNEYSVVPVRFLTACRKGHIDEINWKSFIHRGRRECAAPIYRFTEIGNSGDASDTVVSCTCGERRHLEVGSPGTELEFAL